MRRFQHMYTLRGKHDLRMNLIYDSKTLMELLGHMGLRKFLVLYSRCACRKRRVSRRCCVSDLAFDFHVFQHEDAEIQN